eukprot:g3028.t1
MPGTSERCNTKMNDNIEEQTPDLYLCPISRSLMHDPVALIETGQVYDHSSISKWFESGHNTCPLTGVTLTSRKLVPLPSLSDCIGSWALNHGVVIEQPPPIERQSPKEDGLFKELDNPCQSASLVSRNNVSVYDVKGMTKLLNTQQPTALQYAAMVVLRQLILHSDEKKLRKEIMPHVDIDNLKKLLKNEELQVPATRLLLTMRKALDRDELLQLLVIPHADLQFELLSRLVDHLCYRRPNSNPRTGYFRSMINSIILKKQRQRRMRSDRTDFSSPSALFPQS